jgi:hypothetical protein
VAEPDAAIMRPPRGATVVAKADRAASFADVPGSLVGARPAETHCSELPRTPTSRPGSVGVRRSSPQSSVGADWCETKVVGATKPPAHMRAGHVRVWSYCVLALTHPARGGCCPFPRPAGASRQVRGRLWWFGRGSGDGSLNAGAACDSQGRPIGSATAPSKRGRVKDAGWPLAPRHGSGDVPDPLLTAATVPLVSDLIPNLDDVAAALPATPTGQDAAELAAAVSAAGSWLAVDSALDAVVGSWATS